MSLEALMGWLRERKRQVGQGGKTWLKILSQHSTQKPAAMGGAPNPQGVTPNCHCGIRSAIGGQGPDGFVHECNLALANSFLPNDGLPVDGYGRGACDEDAKNAAAHELLAKLLCRDPWQVRLLDKDWLGGAAEVHAQAALQSACLISQ